MPTKFSQFLQGLTPRNTDIEVGLRSGLNVQGVSSGISDSAGATIVSWLQGAGPNVNYIGLQNNIASSAPVISALGADANVNLNLTPKGTGHIEFTGTGAIGVPVGTTAQQPVGFNGGFRYNSDTDFLEYWDTGAAAWVDVINGAALADATFVTNTDETADLPNSQPLSALATGIMKVTTGTGIVASLAIPLTADLGGSGVASPTAHGVLIAEGASAFATKVLGSGQILIGSAGVDPVVAAINSGTGILVANGAGSITVSNTGVTSIAGTANQITASAATGAITLSIASNPIFPGTGGATMPTGTTGQRAGGAGTLRFNSSTGFTEFTNDGAAWNPISATSGTVTSVSGTTNRITSTGGTTPVIDISASYVGQASITTVGALASGSLAAGFTPVTVPLGGTGNTTFTAYSVICAGTTATGVFQNVSGVGTSGQVLTSNGAAALPTWQAAGGGSGVALTDTITQASHGFSVQQLVYLNGVTYTLAEANSVVTAEVVGIITAVTNANVFVLTTSGKCTGLSGLTAGTVYWLSDGTPGLLTATAPTTAGNVAKPLFVADTTTSGYFINYRGEVIPNPTSALPGNYAVCDGRLTVVSGSPIDTTFPGSVTTLYFTPFKGNQVGVFASSAWSILTLAELTVTIPATTNTPFDIFVYNNGGVLATSTVNWTNDTTRATALAQQDGVYVLSGDATKRYIGSGRTNGSSGHIQVSNGALYIWNYYNRQARILTLSAADGANSWNITSTLSQPLNNDNPNNTFNLIVGVAEDIVDLLASNYSLSTTTWVGSFIMGWTVDYFSGIVIQPYGATSTNGLNNNPAPEMLQASYRATTLAGLHYYTIFQKTVYTSGTATIVANDTGGGKGVNYCTFIC